MKRILVGVDGSSEAANALRWACALAAATGAEVVVGTSGWRDLQEEAAREHWSKPAEEAGVRHREVALRSEIGPALVEAAAKEEADLLVVGHRGRESELQLGSVAMYVAHLASGPFAIVPGTASPRRPHRFVVGLDESEAARAAGAWAETLASACHAEIVGMHVARRPPGASILPSPPEARFRAVTIEGDHPALALLRQVHADAGDVVVIGTRRVRALRPLRMDGVTMQVLHHARVPVITVPQHVPIEAHADKADGEREIWR